MYILLQSRIAVCTAAVNNLVAVSQYRRRVQYCSQYSHRVRYCSLSGLSTAVVYSIAVSLLRGQRSECLE